LADDSKSIELEIEEKLRRRRAIVRKAVSLGTQPIKDKMLDDLDRGIKEAQEELARMKSTFGDLRASMLM
jgi:hypothetical protein